ncbi:receptor expression-enhancing protein 4 isoform X3 [Dermacentor silvarum]|uniref:receptor expression-enhancing protein 4 isoform X3 n=1 Tax=Dermacentor silvarum TaxID=543639 RepID=UPI0021010628|nr:receptor expression-enhancing protein 4 isoform X3 [Dermacentor silvarum]
MGLCSCSRIMLALGLLWPVYASFKTIDERNNGHKTVFLLKYWVSIGTYLLLDCMVEILFGAHFADFISGLRLAAFIWVLVQAPEDLYESLVRPRMKLWEPTIDKFLEELEKLVIFM